jgi:hypothetical protein
MKTLSRASVRAIVGALADRIFEYATMRDSDVFNERYWNAAISETQTAAEEIGEEDLLKLFLRNRGMK